MRSYRVFLLRTTLALTLTASLAGAAMAQQEGHQKDHQKDNRRVSAQPVIEGDPDPTPNDRITIQMLKQKMDDKVRLLILDSRSEGSYEGSELKIKGSVRVALDKIDDALQSGALKSAARDTIIVSYCT
ncbi:MAG: hypothetical protein ACKV2V_06455 [Blastocatellia bacterium]